MTFGAPRGYSDRLERRQVLNMREAAAFAHEIGCPLNVTIDICWGRTWVGDDQDGQILDRLMELTRKRLKRWGARAFAQIEVRECPAGVVHRPNTHLLIHCPESRIGEFETWFRMTLARLCKVAETEAVEFKRTGNGTPTLRAVMGKLAYMSKGLSPIVAARLEIRPEPQGRIYGKRVSISQDINRAARQRHAAATDHQAVAGLQGVCTVAGDDAIAPSHAA